MNSIDQLTTNSGRTRLFVHAAALALLLVLPGTMPLAQYPDENRYGHHDDDDDDQDIQQTVARVSFVFGDVSFSRGDDPDDWQSADINVPMTLGDRVYSGRDGRLELQISAGNFARIGPNTDFTALNLTDDTKQFSITEGVSSFQIRRFDEDEIIEVDTPNAAITFERLGKYRIAVDENGDTRVAVMRGRATVSAGGGEVMLDAGEEMDVYGLDETEYDIVSIGPPDRFDGWVSERERRIARVSSYRYVSPDVVGVEDLDHYGRWVRMPEYGMVWSPTVVQAGWTPYSQGHWVWQDPWGWTWVAAEPWGWAPYHYGRWFVRSSRWYWAPVPPSRRRVAYAPALVAFVGTPRVSVSVSVGSGGGVIGWFPLAPADPLIPWWGSRRQVNVTNVTNNVNITNVNVTNVKYVNKTHVTVVNNNTFVSGDLVQNNIVRDQTVIRQVNETHIENNNTLPVPTRASLRVSAKASKAQEPPRPKIQRHVVARIAPPPEPPRFEKKQRLIEEQKGKPVTPVEATRLAVEQQGQKQEARVPVQAVAQQQGEVKLKARGKGKAVREAQPVRAVRGRPLATKEKPVQPQQTPAEASSQQVAPPSATPGTPPGASPGTPPGAGPSRAPVEGREGREGKGRGGPPPKQNKAQPPAPDPNQPPAADPNKQESKSKGKKRKGGQPEKDPNAATP